MCFLKVINQKEVPQHHSAFKKVNSDTHSSQQNQNQPQKNYQDISQDKDKGLQTQSSNKSEQTMDFFQFQFYMLSEMVNKNNALTLNLLEKNTTMESNIKSLERMVEGLKKGQNTICQENTTDYIPFDNSNYGDNLAKTLFGDKKYRYQIALDEPFQTQLYKERNFDLKLKLIDVQENTILNSNSIPLGLGFYSSDFVPEVLTANKSGQPLLKGNSQSQIYHGRAEFKKLHLREVTSYYRNGWIYLVVFPKPSSFTYNNRESNLQSVIDHNQIKPLVISEVVVRAKKK